MTQNQKQVPVSGMILLITVLLNAIILKTAYIRNDNWYWTLLVSLPLLLIAIWNRRQNKHAIMRNFPIMALYKGLDPSDKSVRVANFHTNTLVATKELMEACGFRDIESIQAKKFFRRISEQETKSFKQIYFPQKGTL